MAEELPSRVPFRWRPAEVGALLGGLVLAGLGVAALLSIPRGLHEFLYDSDHFTTNLEPLPFAPMNGVLPALASSHLARLVFLLPAVALLAWALRRTPIGHWPQLTGRLPPRTLGLLQLVGLLLVA